MIIFRKEGETLEQALKRTMEEKTKLDLKYREPKNITDRPKWFDSAYLIMENFKDELEIKKIYSNEFEDKLYTFKEIMHEFGVDKLKKHTVYTLILNRGLDGEIWQYGNYDKCSQWIFYGETRGYA